jgi:uncharacterized cupredoxin-like copper-binding protein
MKRLLAAAALGAAIVSTQAAARDHDAAMTQDITRQQAQDIAETMFQRLDANHDGIVTRQEAEEAAARFGGGERADRMIERMFADAQSLTLQQAETQALARFDRDDLNHDGVVTAAERQQARAALKAERGQKPGQ